MIWPNSPFGLIFWNKWNIFIPLWSDEFFSFVHILFLIKRYADGEICMSLDKVDSNEVWIKTSCSTNTRYQETGVIHFTSGSSISYKAWTLEVFFGQIHEAMIICFVILHSSFLFPVIFLVVVFWQIYHRTTEWLILASTPSHCLDTSRKVSVSAWKTGILPPLEEIISIVW